MHMEKDQTLITYVPSKLSKSLSLIRVLLTQKYNEIVRQLFRTDTPQHEILLTLSQIHRIPSILSNIDIFCWEILRFAQA